MIKAAAAALVLALPVATTLAAQRAADALGARLGREGAALADLTRASGSVTGPAQANAPLPPAAAPSTSTPLAEASLEDSALSAAGPEAVKRRAGRAPRRGVVHPKSGAATRGIRISANQILGLARARAMPHAVPVAASNQHPAGLRLVGVGGLGVGMRDGDVLSRVSGVPVTSIGAVVELVLSHRGRLAREISAEFWRDGERWALLVEQPYLEPKSPSAPPAAPAP